MKLPFPEPLVERYRPRSIEEFIGLAKAKRILGAFVQRPFDSSWLFNGESGLGKTTMGLVIAEEIDAELHHIPSQKCDQAMVDYTTHRCQLKAFNFETGKAHAKHLVLVDEADGMSIGGQQTLLSKLDASASIPDTVWIFTSNTIKPFEGRFLSRQRIVPFEAEHVEGELEHYLRRVYRKEGGKHPLDFKAIAKEVGYNVRSAMMKLELELLLGDNRKNLPPDKVKQLEEHTHQCKKCERTRKCPDPECGLPFRHDCQSCGGAKSKYQLAAYKAHDTMRKKKALEIKAAIEAATKGKKRRGKDAA